MSKQEWGRIAFGDICSSLVNGGTPNTGVTHYWNGQIPWITGADFLKQSIAQIRRHITPVAINSSATNVVTEGNILLVTRTGVGKIAIAPFDVAISQDITGIYLDDAVEVEFMFFCLQFHLDELKKLNQGTSINGILKEDLLKYEIHLPPLPQQRKIARILTTVDNLIEQTEALIEKYKSIKQGMMHDLFTRGVDSSGRLRPSYEDAPELYKESELGWIPKEWEVRVITECCSEVFLGLTSKVDYVEEGGVPLIRATDIRGGLLSFGKALSISHRQHRELTKYRKAKRGDILVSKSGSLGVCALVDTHTEFSIYESIIVLQPFVESLNSLFLLSLMRHQDTQRRLLGETVGSTVGHLNLNDFKRLLVSVPPVQEQQVIGKAINAQDRDTARNVKALRKYRILKTGLMQDLLTGKVRVNVDETEEVTANV